jgi:phenylpyruvate tautomerase PptA (4-oxalocrotonate tautomerase family)
MDDEEICIIKIENINRELSPYQKCQLIKEVTEEMKEK